ncbi:MAG: hypothetical protein R6X11_01930 [Desulfonatronovibrio sp.]
MENQQKYLKLVLDIRKKNQVDVLWAGWLPEAKATISACGKKAFADGN